MDKKDKNALQKRLAKYGLLTVAIAASSDAEGAIIYTDEAPDFAGGIGSQYFLDLNNDAIDDFRIWHNGSSNLYISPLGSNNEVLGSGGATFAYPFALTSGTTISSGAGQFFNNGFAGGFQSLNYGSCSFGNWCSVTDRYLGLRFDIGGNIHYGWVRLDVNVSGSSWTVKDYAYDDFVGAPIDAGATSSVSTASASSAIVGTDIAENSNGLDLQIDFTAATDETSVGEYRLIVVKAALVGTFNQATAEALPIANYTAILPNGSPSYTQVMNGATIDSDGDAVVIGQPYRIYILNVADGVVATMNSLSIASANVTLNTTVNAATAIVGSDVADNANASDLQVDFGVPVNENGIAEYRVIAVNSGSAAGFNLAAAQALGATAYETQVPTGSAYTVNFNAATTDSDGNAIVIGQPYSIFILSVADGTLANIDSLASSSADVTLNVTTEPVSGIVGTDIAENGNGLDLQVDFDAPSSEFGVLAYRVIAVKSSAAGAFTLNDALNLPSTAWMVVGATGASAYSVVFEALKTDSDGDQITENQPYTIFVVSFADTQQATASSMESSANTVTLMNYVGLDDLSFFNSLEVYPNPNNGSFTIDMNLSEGHSVAYEITDVKGSVIWASEDGFVEGTISKQVQLSSQADGIYFLKISADEQTTVRKIMIK